MLMVSVDQITLDRLRRASIETDRSIEDLARSAVEETALAWARDRGFPEEERDGR